ncbi:MAG TPA: tetratricopeptide repeat protein [Saprospiraceae bacterium]|nr:tetratricopeptide repeat protein [Saprospiraceae bacterium]HRO08138.1 tetratricopeptide repeat protein [Saprospiraceae bacterium]HRO73926.1 tetratricopeptide repeat protein [Saprospiraceae bacterium]HRP41531.1 tetratricopeptide repeat protein [Saprospiraceae bacterium]
MAKGKQKAADSDTLVDIEHVKGGSISAANWFEQNQKLVTNIVIGIAALVAIYMAYKYLYMGPREMEAVNEMYVAEEQFAKDSFALALENPGGGFKGFIGIIDEYSGTKAANLAKYYAGVSYLNLGKFEDAIQYLEDYSAKDEVTTATKAGALGDAYAEKGDKDKAMTMYKKASAFENDMLTPYYLHKIAMMYYADGKTKEALEQLEVIKNKYPTSPEKDMAERLIARLQ